MGRILVVDDEPNMRRILVSNLRQDQHAVQEAVGVEEARAKCAFENGNDHQHEVGAVFVIVHHCEQ